MARQNPPEDGNPEDGTPGPAETRVLADNVADPSGTMWAKGTRLVELPEDFRAVVSANPKLVAEPESDEG